MTDKDFFSEPTAKEIMDHRTVRGFNGNLIKNILYLYEDQGGVIERTLIPDNFDTARRFMKHGEDVKLPRAYTLEEIAHEMPIDQRRIAFSSIENKAYCCYSFKPVVGVDKRTRRVSLTECLEGTKIYCYVHQVPKIAGDPSIDVKPYTDAKGVEKGGAEIIVHVPSRTEKQSKYKIAFESVPIVNNDLQWAIANSIGSDHVCEHKRYQFRYKSPEEQESSNVFNFCAHEIAGYLAIIDFFKSKNNRIPLRMNQFAIPTQRTVDFYDRLGFNCLIKTPEDKHPRKLSGAEKEVLLWGLIKKSGHDKTFYTKENIREYRWRHTVPNEVVQTQQPLVLQ